MRSPRARTTRALVVLLLLTACTTGPEVAAPGGGPGGESAGGVIRMARADWDTGFWQAAVYRQLLGELGYDVTDPAEETHTPETFYPALAAGELDLWVNGWFPLHDPFLDRELVTGQRLSEPVEVVGMQVEQGAVQGYLADKATADDLGITSVTDLGREEVARAFDLDGDGHADLYGCDEGWGCNRTIDAHLAAHGWGASVRQVVGDYGELMADVRDRVDDGEPALFYTWTPNWTVDVLVPGEDVVWLEAPALPGEDRPTSVDGLAGCAGEDPCDLGWVHNDIRAVANAEFLEANPPVRRLLEVVELPVGDIAAQNARMAADDTYGQDDLAADAEEWIAEHRDVVESWLDAARR